MRRAEGPLFWAALAGASLLFGMGAGGITNAVRAAPTATVSINTELVRTALKLRLPKTAIGAIDCGRFGGLCEVVAGATLFYVDRGARFLMIGRLYDMETRSDLTAARLLELNPDLLVTGAAGKRDNADDQPAPAPVKAAKVDLSVLPPGGAIHWGPVNGPRLIVLSDFACSYCRHLSAELVKLGARIEERPISIFGAESRRKAEAVLCAADPAAALHAAYDGRPLRITAKCDVSGLDANEAFAKQHGFSGTPVIIRADGAVIEGFRPADQLKAFIDGGRA
ncbi:DsbC family protein [Sphingomonas solaris]|uniref:Thiol:disulfide interchange protein n=2 Tax=Alterirhizorhabdus solaris TaxID=2529389 RepID=A0A558R5I7_9SPHN|nr:DsbC family protein [Sphingomonas solaris]